MPLGLSDDGRVTRVDARKRQVESAFGQLHTAAVLNVIPPQKAGSSRKRAVSWTPAAGCQSKAESFRDPQVAGIYALGD